MSSIIVKDICYQVAQKKILENVTFSINEGDVLALLGQNGAGKTTLFELLTGIIKPTSGKINYNGNKTFSDVKKYIGVIWDDLVLFPMLKVKEVVKYAVAIYGLDSFPEVLYEYLELKLIENELMQKLSRGEKKRVEILLATMHNPDFLILDEPTSELDPMVRNLIWENIILNKKRTVIFSTHQWEEAAKYSTLIAFIYKGKILNTPSSKEEIIKKYGFTKKIVVSHVIDAPIFDNIFSYKTENSIIYLLGDNNSDFITRIKSETTNYSILPIQIEDIYHFLTYQIK